MCPAETPLSLAVQCEPGGGEAIRVLVEGGAHIDFRAKDGLTSIHKAVRGHRHTALLVHNHFADMLLIHMATKTFSLFHRKRRRKDAEDQFSP